MYGIYWPISILEDVINYLILLTNSYENLTTEIPYSEEVMFYTKNIIHENNSFYNTKVVYNGQTFDDVIYDLSNDTYNFDKLSYNHFQNYLLETGVVKELFKPIRVISYKENNNMKNNVDLHKNNNPLFGTYVHATDFAKSCDQLKTSKGYLKDKGEWVYYVFPKTIHSDHKLKRINVRHDSGKKVVRHVPESLLKELGLTAKNNTIPKHELLRKINEIKSTINFINTMNEEYKDCINVLQNGELTNEKISELLLEIIEFVFKNYRTLRMKHYLHKLLYEEMNDINEIIKCFINIVKINDHNINVNIEDDITDEEMDDLLEKLFFDGYHTFIKHGKTSEFEYVLLNCVDKYGKQLKNIFIENKDVKFINDINGVNFIDCMKEFLLKGVKQDELKNDYSNILECMENKKYIRNFKKYVLETDGKITCLEIPKLLDHKKK